MAIFIDGAYLNKVLQRHHGGTPVDYEKLARHLAANSDILRTYYYDAPPWQSNPPTADESRRFAARQSFFASLRKLPKFEVREGRCARIWDTYRNDWKYQQKRVDVLFSVDLVRLASKSRIDQAVLVAGDSDFLPAVAVAKDEGVSITLIHSPNLKEVHRELWDAADDRAPLDTVTVSAVARATVVPLPTARTT
ncbi:MAG TPA: NYN domain-containing protein [Polyangia bacterium]